MDNLVVSIFVVYDLVLLTLPALSITRTFHVIVPVFVFGIVIVSILLLLLSTTFVQVEPPSSDTSKYAHPLSVSDDSVIGLNVAYTLSFTQVPELDSVSPSAFVFFNTTVGVDNLVVSIFVVNDLVLLIFPALSIALTFHAIVPVFVFGIVIVPTLLLLLSTTFVQVEPPSSDTSKYAHPLSVSDDSVIGLNVAYTLSFTQVPELDSVSPSAFVFFNTTVGVDNLVVSILVVNDLVLLTFPALSIALTFHVIVPVLVLAIVV